MRAIKFLAVALVFAVTLPLGAAPQKTTPNGKKIRPRGPDGELTPDENNEGMMKYLAYIPDDVLSGRMRSGWGYRYDIRIGPDDRGVIMCLGGVREKPFTDGLGRHVSVELIARKKDGKTDLGVKLPPKPVIVRDEQWVREEVDSILEQGLAIPVKFVIEGKWLDVLPPSFIRTPKTKANNAQLDQDYWVTASGLWMNGESGYIRKDEPLFKSFSDRFGFAAKARRDKDGVWDYCLDGVTLGFLVAPSATEFDPAQYIPVNFVEKGRKIPSLPERIRRYPDEHRPGERVWISQGDCYIKITGVSQELRFDFAKSRVVSREPFINPYGPAIGVRAKDWKGWDPDREVGGADWDPPKPNLFWRWPIRRKPPTSDEVNGRRYQYCLP